MKQALAGIDRVVLAWSDADPRFIERLLGHCRRLEVKLSVISPFRGRARPLPTALPGRRPAGARIQHLGRPALDRRR